jgi:hypothetical protein
VGRSTRGTSIILEVNAATLRFTDVYTRVTRTEYDSLSRPVTMTLNYRPGLPVLADTNVKLYTRYDGASNVITQTDALGRWTAIGYDRLNRPITTTLNYQDGKPLTGPRDADIVTVTHYDAAGRVDKQTDNYVDGVFSATEPITDRVTLSQYDTLGRSTTTMLNCATSVTDPAFNRSSATWRTNLATYADMVTRQLYTGVDLYYQGIDG